MDVTPPVSDPRKVLYVITKATWGGAQRYVFDLIQESRARGYEPFLAYGTPGLLSERVGALGISTHQIAALARDISLGQDFRAYRELSQVFKEVRPDVVHLNSSKAAAIGAFAARSAGIRHIVFTAHGWAFNESRSVLSRFTFALIHYVTVLLSHQAIMVSNVLARQAAHWPFIQKKLRVIHLGIRPSTTYSRTEARERLVALDPSLANSRDALWIGTIAELHPNKGIDIGINAWKEVPAGMQWLVLGSGEEEDTLKEHIGERTDIHLLGFVPDAAQYLAAFDLFLLPSRTEAFGYVLLEAGSVGIPVLASRVGGIPEIIPSNAFGTLYTCNDTQTLAAKLVAFMRDPSGFRETGVALKKRVQETFSLEKMIETTFALYSR